MDFNNTQREYLLGRHGADALTREGFHKLSPVERLQIAELEPTPEPEVLDPVMDNLTGAQREYLGDRRPEDLTTPLDKENFEWLGGPIFRRGEEAKEEQAITPEVADTGPADISHLRPEVRLHMDECRQTLARHADEVARGIPEHLRTVKPDRVASARLFLGPYA